MWKRLSVLLAVACLTLLLVLPTAAQQPQHSDPTWSGTYWNNATLSGTPALTRQDAALDFDWGTGSPDSAIGADTFSARWTRYLYVEPGTYRFTTRSDDGIRLWVDNTLLIDDWTDHAVRTHSADVYLGPGHHWVVVEYYENGGLAVLGVSYAPVPEPITDWRGEYFNSDVPSGTPALVRNDAHINFNWGTGSPASEVRKDYFSARWSRDMALPAGNYRFSVTVDDGARLWVNDHLLVDEWRLQSVRTFNEEIYLPGGTVPVVLEYCELWGNAVVQMSYSAVSDTVVVDNTSDGFVAGGTASSWRSVSGGYGGSFLWTYNNARATFGYNWGRWYPDLAPGRYEVYVYVPAQHATTRQARYWVSHADGFTLRLVNQMAYSDRWVSLGTYRFSGGRSDYVSLADVTYEPYLSRQVAWDAIKWEVR